MPRGVGFYDLSEYLQDLLNKLLSIPEDMLSPEIVEIIKHPTNIALDQLSEELRKQVLTVNNVGYDNLDDWLKAKIDDIGKIENVDSSVYISNSSVRKGYREINTTPVYDVNFICGHIESVDIVRDTLNVYLNTIRLVEGVDYELNEDRVSIHCLSDEGWTLNNGESSNIFEFEQYRDTTMNANNDGFITNDYIKDGAIGIEKLSDILRDMITNPSTMITNNVYYGYRVITRNTPVVNFMCGDIVTFNPDKDTLEVFLNTTRLTKDVHYKLSDDGISITKLDEGTEWELEEETENLFEFRVQKNGASNISPDNAEFVGTDNVKNNSITVNKLSQEVQVLLNKTMIYNHGFTQMNTTFNEISYLIGDITEIHSQSIVNVFVNSTRLTRDHDYTVNYDTNKIQFTNTYNGSTTPVFIEVEVWTMSDKDLSDIASVATLLDKVTELSNRVSVLEQKLQS